MPKHAPPPAAAASLHLDGELTIYRAGELKPQLLQALRAAPRLEVDLAGVTEVDTAGLQLLMLLKREAAAGDHELVLTRHSQVVVDAFELLDLAPFFGDPIVTEGVTP